MAAAHHDDRPPLEGGARGLITFSLSLAVFMQVLDTTIANVAVPTLAGDLGVSASQGTWVITSFGVANAIALPLTGWLARRFGEVRMFTVATLAFVAASLLCGFSQSLEFLIFARVLQGLAAGPMFPLAQSLMLGAYPPHQRGMAMAISMMVAVVGPIAGPLLGGWITDSFHWSWIFFINVPVGILAVALSWPVLKTRESRTAQVPIDRIGLALLVIGVGALQLMLDKGNELDWFESPEVIALGVIAALGLALLVVWELTDEHPVVDLRLFGEPNFAFGTLAISLGYMTFMGGVVLFPLWLQTTLGYTATWAGIVSAPIGVLPVILAPLIGKNMARLNLRWMVTLAFAVFAFTFWWQSHLTPGVDPWHLAQPRFVQGVALACFFAPLTTIIVSRVPPGHMASAMGLATFLRVLGGSFGTSLTVAYWDHKTAVHHSELAERMTIANDPFNAALTGLQNLGMSAAQALGTVERLLNQQAVTKATLDAFTLAAMMFVGLSVLVWLTKPVKAAGAPPPME